MYQSTQFMGRKRPVELWFDHAATAGIPLHCAIVARSVPSFGASAESSLGSQPVPGTFGTAPAPAAGGCSWVALPASIVDTKFRKQPTVTSNRSRQNGPSVARAVG